MLLDFDYSVYCVLFVIMFLQHLHITISYIVSMHRKFIMASFDDIEYFLSPLELQISSSDLWRKYLNRSYIICLH